jgi:hypothetical protein
MWIVRLALRRPYTFVVAAVVLLLLTPFVLLRTPTDIFPAINIPVVSAVWTYTGLSAREVEQRILYFHERMIGAGVRGVGPGGDVAEVPHGNVVRRDALSLLPAGAGRRAADEQPVRGKLCARGRGASAHGGDGNGAAQPEHATTAR